MRYDGGPMNRPTIADLARAAGVSVSTVNRILGGSESVRPATIQRVQEAAREIGFYGVGVIDARRKEAMPQYPPRLPAAAVAPRTLSTDGPEDPGGGGPAATSEVEPVIEFVDSLEPEHIAARLKALGDTCDAVAVIAADHPSSASRSTHSRPRASRSSPISPISPLQTAPDTSAPTTGSSGAPPPGSSPGPPTPRGG